MRSSSLASINEIPALRWGRLQLHAEKYHPEEVCQEDYL
jgi:hypothetical protein